MKHFKKKPRIIKLKENESIIYMVQNNATDANILMDVLGRAGVRWTGSGNYLMNEYVPERIRDIILFHFNSHNARHRMYQVTETRWVKPTTYTTNNRTLFINSVKAFMKRYNS